MLVEDSAYHGLPVGASYVLLAPLLLLAVFRRKPAAGACYESTARSGLPRRQALLPLAMGLLAGLKICPPLLLASTDASNAETLVGSLLLSRPHRAAKSGSASPDVARVFARC